MLPEAPAERRPVEPPFLLCLWTVCQVICQLRVPVLQGPFCGSCDSCVVRLVLVFWGTEDVSSGAPCCAVPSAVSESPSCRDEPSSVPPGGTQLSLACLSFWPCWVCGSRFGKCLIQDFHNCCRVIPFCNFVIRSSSGTPVREDGLEMSCRVFSYVPWKVVRSGLFLPPLGLRFSCRKAVTAPVVFPDCRGDCY